MSYRLADDAVALARTWVTSAGADDKSARLLGRLVADQEGLAFAMAFVDRVVRPEDVKVAARALAELSRTPPKFLPAGLRLLVRAARLAPVAPSIAVGMARRVLRSLVSHLVIDARPHRLRPAIRTLRRRGDRLNVNLLGEAVLGKQEAAARLAATERLVRRPDVDYVSVKVSSVMAQLSMWAFDEMVDEVVATLRPLFETAAAHRTFINLDMEEYRDLDLTIAVFQRLLDHPKLKNYHAGIVLQTYLPDAMAALDHLTDWATKRVRSGGAPIKVRIVKGANLAMERAEATVHGWPPAPFDTKVETDANYKRVLAAALVPARSKAVHTGVAGHNLFDLAFAHLLAQERHVPAEHLSFEMLLGMATAYAEQVRATVGPLLLYTPVVAPAQFEFAIAYLVRRLEENAASANFMSAVFSLRDEAIFSREEERFRSAVELMDDEVSGPRRRQSRPAEEKAKPRSRKAAALPAASFHNEPDTDPALAVNREWGRARLAASTSTKLGLKTIKAARITSARALDRVIEQAQHAAAGWAARGPQERGQILRAVADLMAARRGDFIEIMAAEGGKTIDQSDPEVSEAIDFARYYAERGAEPITGATFIPDRVTVITPPWNFPVAIPAGSALAALATGSAVILKPAGLTKRCGALIAEIMWQAGVPRDVLHLIDVAEDDLGRHLITHPDVDRVILTGSFETAALFRSWRPDLPLLAETSGKNSLIVTPAADFDLAVMDAARSAFGHAGQKCSAASLLILVGSVGYSERFQRQLLDAVSTLRVGYPEHPESTMGPVIAPPEGKLKEGLTRLERGQRWLLKPRQLDRSGRLWSPGIRTGVRPGSRFHQTEYFGPVLGIMRAASLAQAVEWQNGVDYGLTAGLHTLDPTELGYWLEHVHAGNLYVNRVTTGAIVERQPFGGWKKSSVGGGAKAGGPNYLLSFGRWEEQLPSDEVGASPLPGPVWKLLDAASELLGSDEVAVRDACARDAYWIDREYGRAHDVSQLIVEINALRYRPLPVTIRLPEQAPVADLIRQVAAGLAVGAPLAVSVDPSAPAALTSVLAAAGLKARSETQGDFIVRMRKERPERIRIIPGGAEDANELAQALAGDPAVAIKAGASTYSGRLEPLFYLREQAVSITAHRFGEVDDWAADMVKP